MWYSALNMSIISAGDRHIDTGVGGLGILFLLWGGWHLLKLLFSSSNNQKGNKK